MNARSKGTVFYNTTSQGSYNMYKRIVYDDLEGVVRDNAFGWIIGGGITIPVFERLAIESGLQYREVSERFLTSRICRETMHS